MIATDSDPTTPGWDGGATPNTGSLSPGGTANYVVRVTIPGGTAAATQSSFSLTATSTTNTNVSASAFDEIVVVDAGSLPPEALDILVAPDNASIAEPGDTVVYTHTITNNTGSSDAFDLLASNDLGTWSTLFFQDSNGDGVYTPGVDAQIVQTSTLADGASQRIFTVVHVPSGAVDGEINVTHVTATSQADSNLNGFATDTTTVEKPTAEGDIQLVPDRSSTVGPGDTASYLHTLSNDSGATQDVEIIADGTKLWTRDLLVDTTGDGTPDTIIAQDTDGDGDWDVINTAPANVSDSDSDGNPEVNVTDGSSVALRLDVDVPGGASNGDVDSTALTATAIANSQLTDSTTDVTTTGDILLEPNNSQTANAGDTITHSHTLTNNAGSLQTLEIKASGTQGWQRDLVVGGVVIARDSDGEGDWDQIDADGDGSFDPPGTTGTFNADGDGFPDFTIADAGTQNFDLEVVVPGGAAAGDVDTATILAASDTSATLSDSAVDVTTVGNIAFTPDYQRAADASDVVPYRHVLTNNTGSAYRFELTVNDITPQTTWIRELIDESTELVLAVDTDGDGVWNQVDYDADGVLEAFSTTPACAPSCANDSDNDGDPDVPLADGASSSLQLRVTVPAGAAIGDVNTSVLTATAQSNSAITDFVTDITVVGGVLDFDHSGGGSHVVSAGDTDIFPGTISNEGELTDSYELTISGSDYGPGGPVEDVCLNHPTVVRIDSDGDGDVDASDQIIATDTEGDGIWNSINTGTFGAFTVTDTDGDGNPEIQLTSGQAVPYALFRDVDPTQGPYRDPVTLTAASVGTNDKKSVTATTSILLATRALIGGLLAYGSDDGVVVEWHTLAEHGTVGFHLARLNESSGEFELVTKKLLPGLLHSRHGGVYRLRDPRVRVGDFVSYQLVELEATGARLTYGPFDVWVGPVRPSDAPVIEADGKGDRPLPGFERVARAMSALEQARIADKIAAREAAWLNKADRKGPVAKVMVREPGLYGLEAAAIAGVMGMEESEIVKLIADRKLRLTNRGEPVATAPMAGNAGLYFYGKAITSQYTEDNVYVLSQATGLRMGTRNAGQPAPVFGQTFTETMHAEGNQFTVTHLFDDPDDDYWMWDFRFEDLIFPTYVDPFPVPSPGLATQSGDKAVLKVRLHGGSETDDDFDHKARIVVNGVEIGETEWDGLQPHEAEFEVELSALIDGDNEVEVFGTASGIPSQPSIFYVNSFELSYPRRYQSLAGSL